MDDIGWSELEIRAALARTFQRDLERDATRAGDAAGSRAGSRMGSEMGSKASHAMRHHFSETAKYIVGPLVAAFSVEKIGEVLGESVHAAADLEATNRRNTLIFGKQREEVDRFGESAAKSYGLADLQARKAASGFGILYKNAGLSRKENAELSVQMVKLGADLSAFNNADPAQVYNALTRGAAGSTRGLKPLGVLLDSNAIKAEALAEGLVKPVKDSAKIHAAQVRLLTDQAAYNKALNGGLASQEAHAKTHSALAAVRTQEAAYAAAVKKHGKGSTEAAAAEARLAAAHVAVAKGQAAESAALSQYGPHSLAAQQALAKLNTDHEALKKDVEGVIPPLTQQQKVLASTALILKQTTAQQGAFHRSSGDLVEQQRVLSAEWANAKDRIGKGLMPIEKELVGVLNRELVPALDKSSRWFEDKGAPALHHFTDEAEPLATEVLPALGGSLKVVAGVTKHLAPSVAAIITSFSRLPKPLQEALVIGAGAAYVGKRTGLIGAGIKVLEGGGGGATALIGKGSTPANPLYVWNVNGGKAPGTGGPPTAVDPRGAARAGGSLAEAEAEASRAAKAAAEAVRAAGGGAAAESAGAARAFKEAMAAHDLAVMREALTFGGGGLRSTLFRGIFGAPAAVSLGGIGTEVNPQHKTPVAGSALARDLRQQYRSGMSLPDIYKFYGQAGGLTKAQIDGLLRIPEIRSTSTSVNALVASAGGASRALDLVGHGGRADVNALIGALADYRKGLGTLPERVQTKVLTPGLLDSITDLEHLARDEHLTPRTINQLFRLMGLEKARQEFDALQNHMGQHKSFEQTIELAGHGQGGINVNGGDVHIHGDERAASEWRRRTRQRANSDGVRRGS